MSYLSFKGTAGRSEYWGVTVITTIGFMIAIAIGTALLATVEITGMIVGGLVMLASVIFYCWFFLAVTIKRCRDAGINPWWTAACFLPYVGIIPWIVFGCLSPEKKVE